MNAFTSVSLEPPLVLVSIVRSAKSCAKLEARPFTVNVLASDQLPIAMQFAGQPGGKLGLRWDRGGAAPHLSNALAWMLRAWTEREPFAFNGRFSKHAHVNIWPRPLQHLRPPVTITGIGNPQTMKFTPENGYRFNDRGWFGVKATGRRMFDRFWSIADEL